VYNSNLVGETCGIQWVGKVRCFQRWITWFAGLIGVCAAGFLRAEAFDSFTSRDRELVVYDGSSPEIRGLAAASMVPTMALSREETSLTQLTRIVREQRPRVLHIVAHGSPGFVSIGGGEWIYEESLLRHATELKGWSVDSIVLWSCRAGADERFVQTLERLTGAKVSASSSVIGHSDLGASWQLTRNADRVKNPFSKSALDSWRYSLPTAYLHGLYRPTASGDPDTYFSEETSSVTISTTPISVKGVTFFQAGAQFSGNNVVGLLSWIDSSGVSQSATVNVSRPIKDGSVVQGFYAWVDNAPTGGGGGPEDRAWV
jgi:hypothetical protein